MLALISPAKTLDLAPSRLALPGTQPEFLADARQLAVQLRGLNAEALGALLGISPALARLNWERFQAFAHDPVPAAAKCAAEMYRGDTYEGLAVDSWSQADWQAAQQSLRILSGLYGLLRPLDLIQPYRLEMSTRLATPRGKDLYAFWGQRLAEHITTLAASQPNRTVINLASEEYSKAVPDVPMLTPVFKEARQGRMQVIGLLAKRARGAMARFMITQRLTGPESLQGFTEGGYRFRADLSDESRWIFVREAPAA